ncbi:MAG: hypothetical protein ACFB5Z_07700 [Elainellaceae cyanobacterium]
MIEVLGLTALLIPVISVFFLLYNHEKAWRRSFLSSWIIWGVTLTAITEMLSLFYRLNHFSLLGFWALSGLFSLVLLLRTCRLKRVFSNARELFRFFARSIKSYPLLGFALLNIALILTVAALLAIAAPPNNWDSMTYHMSRVVNWIQNQTVAHYPTHMIRQLDLAPWSNFAVMHLQLLSGSDRFANLVQWSSMVGCVVGVSLIAKQLQADLAGQIVASVVCLSIPMGLLQSVTTQNDYVVSFWLVCLTYNALLITEQQITPRAVFELSASLGLAILTKATAYIYAFPFCLVSAVIATKYSRVRVVKLVIPGALSAILINIGHWWRNWSTFQDFLGSSGDVTRNQLFTPAAILSNTIRNIALHTPTVSYTINSYIEYAVVKLHDVFLQLDVNDPRTTFLGTEFSIPVTPKGQPIFLNEDVSGNPIHLVLVVICIGFYLAYKRTRNRQRTVYIFALLSTIVLFNTVVSWQPWATRLHLPFFVLMAALIGSVLCDVVSLTPLRQLMIFALSISSLPYIFFSAVRPLTNSPYFLTFTSSIFDISQRSRRFTSRPNLENSYVEAIDIALEYSCYDIGLYLGGEGWDYPFWAIAQGKSPQNPVIFRSVEVSNKSQDISAPLPRRSRPPCAIFVVDRPDVKRKRISLTSLKLGREFVYLRAMRSRSVRVFIRRRLLKEKGRPERTLRTENTGLVYTGSYEL